ncbi:hypothetical protein AVEN_119215-1 [Araneus ventricosus]|uniref:Uncharacterized protein n=1 Tax=Araneus ventricosus TaxID=182803 RepID=A0A4Y2NUZ3_ARAVE|nr:hypothetical protein AVEN_119215-1 [Araneus ventricosus]
MFALMVAQKDLPYSLPPSTTVASMAIVEERKISADQLKLKSNMEMEQKREEHEISMAVRQEEHILNMKIKKEKDLPYSLGGIASEAFPDMFIYSKIAKEFSCSRK